MKEKDDFQREDLEIEPKNDNLDKDPENDKESNIKKNEDQDNSKIINDETKESTNQEDSSSQGFLKQLHERKKEKQNDEDKSKISDGSDIKEEDAENKNVKHVSDNIKEDKLEKNKDLLSIGTVLKNAREEKRISLQDVEKITKISTKTIKALEENNFAVFESSTYAIGFIKTYTNFLNLDSSEIVARYKAAVKEDNFIEEKIQAPAVQINILPIVFISIVILFFGALGFLVYSYKDLTISYFKELFSKKSATSQDSKTETALSQKPKSSISGPILKGESVNLLYENDNGISTNLQVKIASIFKSFCEIIINDEKKEIVYLNDTRSFKLDNKHYFSFNLQNIDFDNYQIDYNLKINNGSFENNQKGEQVTIDSSDSKKNINLKLVINPNAFLSYKSDDKDIVRLFYEDKTELNISASNKLDLDISNSNLIKIFYKNQQVPSKADLQNYYFHWDKSDDGGYNLDYSENIDKVFY